MNSSETQPLAFIAAQYVRHVRPEQGWGVRAYAARSACVRVQREITNQFSRHTAHTRQECREEMLCVGAVL